MRRVGYVPNPAPFATSPTLASPGDDPSGGPTAPLRSTWPADEPDRSSTGFRIALGVWSALVLLYVAAVGLVMSASGCAAGAPLARGLCSLGGIALLYTAVAAWGWGVIVLAALKYLLARD